MRTRNRTALRGATSAMAVAGLLTLAGPAGAALPVGPEVRHGQEHLKFQTSADGRTMTISQSRLAAAIDWEAFDIGQGHGVQFVQPSTDAFIVNRVKGSGPSQIDGALTATGQVYLINPNGITFGETARVDVGGLVAAAARLSDAQMTDGGAPTELLSQGDVRNAGMLRVIGNGVMTLVGHRVIQDGAIQAERGQVNLLAGDRLSLYPDGDRGAFGGTRAGLEVTHAGTTQGNLVHLAAGQGDGASIVMSPGSSIDATRRLRIHRHRKGTGAPPLTLAGVRAGELEIESPIRAHWVTRDKAYDGHATADVDGSAVVEGIALTQDSNLKISQSYQFDDASPGKDRRVTGTLHVTGFHGDESVALPISGESSATITPPTLPKGFDLRFGDARVEDEGHRLVVTQGSDLAKVDWQTFDIGQFGTVHFKQPGAQALIVNRVVNAGTGVIDGTITADGRVYLIQPDGLLLGRTARVSAAGFLASTHRLGDEAMTDASTALNLASVADDSSFLDQHGVITVDGGVLTLAASGSMEQTGTLSAPAGAVHLAVAKQVALAETGKIDQAEGKSGRLVHTGTTSAVDGEVHMHTGGSLILDGTVDASGQGQVALHSGSEELEVRGDVRPGKRLFIDDGVAVVDALQSADDPSVGKLTRWLNDGVDVEIRRNEGGNLLVTRPISTEKSARGSLTLEGRGVSFDSPLHLGDGDLTVRGLELWQGAPIRSERGAIIVETARASLQQMHAPELRISTPMTVSFSARDKVHDGTTVAVVDDAAYSGIRLREDSNLRLVPTYAFDSAKPGERTVSASMVVTGFHGDATAPVPVIGKATARIEPLPMTSPVAPVATDPEGAVSRPPSVDPQIAVVPATPIESSTRIEPTSSTGSTIANVPTRLVVPIKPIDSTAPAGVAPRLEPLKPTEPARPPIAARRAIACEEGRGGALPATCGRSAVALPGPAAPPGPAASAVSGGIRLPTDLSVAPPRR